MRFRGLPCSASRSCGEESVCSASKGGSRSRCIRDSPPQVLESGDKVRGAGLGEWKPPYSKQAPSSGGELQREPEVGEMQTDLQQGTCEDIRGERPNQMDSGRG